MLPLSDNQPSECVLQTRTHLPVWLGIGEALKKAIADGHADLLTEMYNTWPFFQVEIFGIVDRRAHYLASALHCYLLLTTLAVKGSMRGGHPQQLPLKLLPCTCTVKFFFPAC